MSYCRRRVVYAFPHAGASASIYRPWMQRLGESSIVTFSPIEIPGRGSLIRQPPIDALHELLTWISARIYDDFHRRQADGAIGLVTFGHSFGGVLSFAVATELHARFNMRPDLVVISASVAPNIQTNDDRHRLSDDEILDRARNDNATPEAVLRDPALKKHVVAQLRNDYIIRSQYPQIAGNVLNCPLVYIEASRDRHIPTQNVAAWNKLSDRGVEVVTIEGDHFAIYDNLPVVERLLSRPLASDNPVAGVEVE